MIICRFIRIIPDFDLVDRTGVRPEVFRGTSGNQCARTCSTIGQALRCDTRDSVPCRRSLAGAAGWRRGGLAMTDTGALLDYEIIDTLPGLKTIEKEWNQLWDSSTESFVTYSYQFTKA